MRLRSFIPAALVLASVAVAACSGDDTASPQDAGHDATTDGPSAVDSGHDANPGTEDGGKDAETPDAGDAGDAGKTDGGDAGHADAGDGGSDASDASDAADAQG